MEISGYKIKHRIGQGGMATVYIAVQESLNRSVALKILDINNPSANETLIKRFLAEGRIVAKLNHPNIITIFDIGVANNSLYISMEYVDGGDLKMRMAVPTPPDTALEYLIKIGSGLDMAHKMGVVHRDIKPENIIFRDKNTPLITDFGIAKQTNAMDNNLTSTGLFLGSPNYMSPEQADDIEIDGRADIYSLGCLFYEMLTCKKPYNSTTLFDVIIKHKQAPIPVFDEDLSRFQPLLDKMMAKNRNDRFNDAAEMVESAKKLQEIEGNVTAVTDDNIPLQKVTQKKAQTLNILLLFLMTTGAIFGTLQYAESRMHNDSPNIKNVPANMSWPDNINQSMINNAIQSVSTDTAETPVNISADVIEALHWLGKKSLEDYRLTHPEKDNAYYYYSRLLEANPSDKTAAKGLLNIANKYAYLADVSVIENDYDKAQAYISIGLKFNPNHNALIKLKKLNLSVQKKSFMEKLVNLFEK